MRKYRGGAAAAAALLLLAVAPAGASERFDDVVQFGTAPGMEQVWDVVRDAAGNSYVVGKTWGAFPGYVNEPEADGFVLKVGATGQLLWVDQFGGEDNGDNVAAAVALDGQGGVYVVGSTHQDLHATAEGYTDAFVRKYSEDGDLLWGDQFHGPQPATAENWLEHASDVAIADGVIHVVGSVDGHGFLRRYSPSGQLLQHQDEDGGEVAAVAAVGSDVYVLGVRFVPLDPWSERVVYLRRITETGTSEIELDGSSWPDGLATTDDAVVVVRTMLDGSGTTVTKFDRQLSEVWTAALGGDPVYGVAVSEAGDVITVGAVDWSGDGYVRKQGGLDGAVIWQARLDGAGMGVGAVDIVGDQVVFAGSSSGELTPGGVGAYVATWPTLRAVPVTRLAGTDRIGTAIAISQATFADGTAGGAVLVSARSFADGVVSAPLAGMVGGPVLLVGDQLGAGVGTELTRLLAPGSTVTIVGGPGAVAATVEAAVRSLGFEVTRLSGSTRFDTAVEVARSMGSPPAMVANGLTFPDALVASAAALQTGQAVVLSNGAGLPAVTREYLLEVGSGHVAVGGPAATAAPGARTLVGGDRYETAALVLQELFGTPQVIGVASGADFADALAIVPMLARQGAPLLLTGPDELAPATAEHLGLGLLELYLAGGPAAVSAPVEQQMTALLTEG